MGLPKGFINNIQNQGKKKYIVLGIILLTALIFYCLSLTTSGLWYDEAIEYWYSKSFVGSVPGGRDCTNMYERIAKTYQPPLYNFFMHFWLLIYDSEAWFRLAGVITTLIGSIGIFFAVSEETKDDFLSEIGTVAYLYTPAVVYYGLECAEYNLMLAMLSWTIFFYIRYRQRQEPPILIAFYVFSTLSVYSQYGAAFLILGMWISLIGESKKNKIALRLHSILTGGTAVLFVLPLVYFFLIPQVIKQQSISVSHVPHFYINAIVDFFALGLHRLVTFIFCQYWIERCSKIAEILILFVVCSAFLGCLKNRKSKIHFVRVLSLTYSFYFISVACSIYGYNSWNSSNRGTNNLGGRYSLFFAPFIIVFLVIGVKQLIDGLKNIRLKKLLLCINGTMIATLILGEALNAIVVRGGRKDDVRELTEVYLREDSEIQVLVSQWDDAAFNFYLSHDERFNSEDLRNIYCLAERPGTNQVEIINQLNESGYITLDEFYFVAAVCEETDEFVKVFESYGFNPEYIYNGNNVLMKVYK